MDSKGKRRSLALALLAYSGLAFIRRPSVVLVLLALVYWKAESLFGVAPLRLFELGEWISSQPEAAIAAAGVVVAVASMLAFKRVKRLDLELSVGAEISVILKESIEIINRTRSYCSDIDLLKCILVEVSADPPPSPARVAERMTMLEIRWKMLLEEVPQLRIDQDTIWDIHTRIEDLFTMHGVVLRSKVVTPFLLWVAQRSAIEIAQQMRLLLPKDNTKAGAFLDDLEIYKGISVKDFRRADAKHGRTLSGCLSGAAAIGTSSILPPASLTVAALAFKLWRS